MKCLRYPWFIYHFYDPILTLTDSFDQLKKNSLPIPTKEMASFSFQPNCYHPCLAPSCSHYHRTNKASSLLSLSSKLISFLKSFQTAPDGVRPNFPQDPTILGVHISMTAIVPCHVIAWTSTCPADCRLP